MAREMKPDTEIRFIPHDHQCNLGSRLNLSNSWKAVMGLVPSIKYPGKMRFTTEDIATVEDIAR